MPNSFFARKYCEAELLSLMPNSCAISLWLFCSKTNMLRTSLYPSGNSPIILVSSAGGTLSTSDSSSSISSGTSSTIVKRFCCLTKLTASFVTIRKSQA
ncbi:Uncharacterised protein [Segatella copri]|nr:Uncharacterised protein [Segatella copri]